MLQVGDRVKGISDGIDGFIGWVRGFGKRGVHVEFDGVMVWCAPSELALYPSWTEEID